MTQGEPLRARAERLRPPLFESGGALGALSPMEHNQLKHKAKTLAEVLQRSSANVAERNGDLSLRNHQRRGLDHLRKRECLTAGHTFLLVRPDGTTRQSAFSGRSPGRCLPRYWSQWRSLLLPSGLRDEQWDRLKGCRVADAVIKANLCIITFAFEKHFAPSSGHIRFFSKRSMSQCLQSGSFRVEQIYGIGRYWPVWKSMFVVAWKHA